MEKIKTDPNKPLILIVNDDSIYAKGIKNLVAAVKDMGQVVVVAPGLPQSGMGHAVTLTSPLRLRKVDRFKGIENSYSCSGTPVDCVKIARDIILDRKPDICLSGINHGSNSSINILYSGTMSAAVEAAIEGIPSIGFSLDDHDHDADFDTSIVVVRRIVQEMMTKKLPNNSLLNVNIPNVKLDQLAGYKYCRQAIAKWEEEFETKVDPRGRPYYWLTGHFNNYDEGQDTDEWALKNNYVSIVPVSIDLTDYQNLDYLSKKWTL